MRPVSQQYIDAIAKSDCKVDTEVSYKRRYWDATLRRYVFESDWTIIPKDGVIAVSPITEQLDSERLNEFKISNITLNFLNKDNRWRADNPAGIFGPDSFSPLYAYSDHWTKFRVRIGVKLLDGSTEHTSRFVGLAVEFSHSSTDEVQVTVQGIESLLQNANAEDVSTRVVEENVGSGNGVTPSFTTTHPGVGIIEEVSVGGIAKIPGTDYDESDLNDISLGAKITFDPPLASGVVRVTYRYWKQGQTVESLVEDLLTEAGIPAPAQIVDPVIFPGGISRIFSVDSQGDWNAGSLSGLDSASAPGDIKLDFDQKTLLDDFTDGDYTSSPAWTASVSPSSSPWAVSGGTLTLDRSPIVGPSTAIITTPSTAVVGSWEFELLQNSGAGLGKQHVVFAFIASSASLAGGPANAYAIQLMDDTQTRIRLVKTDAAGAITVLQSVSVANNYFFTNRTYKVVRTASGQFSVYVDGALIITHTDTSITSSTIVAIHSSTSVTANYATLVLDGIYSPPPSIDGEYISEALDAGVSVTSYGRLIVIATPGLGTVTWFTRTSTDGMSWDAWIEISANGQINSDVHRWIQVKGVHETASDVMGDPTSGSYTLQYSAVSTTISLANFTEKTVYEQIQELGAFANYEWGPTPDEDFFFRPKSVLKNPVVELTRERNLLEINGLVSGQDRVYSEVRATYGRFSSRTRVAGDTYGDAKAKFGSRVLSISGGDVLVGDDANIAAGVAAALAAEVGHARRRMKAVCKLMPYVDLSDVVLVSFDQNVPRPSWRHGDTTAQLGDQNLQHFGAKQQLVSGMYAKVIGARHDPLNFKTEFDLQEVL